MEKVTYTKEEITLACTKIVTECEEEIPRSKDNLNDWLRGYRRGAIRLAEDIISNGKSNS